MEQEQLSVEVIRRTHLARVAPSTVHGVGAIAIADIKKGQSVFNKTPGHFTLSRDELLSLDSALRDYVTAMFMQTNEGIDVWCLNKKLSPEHFINHSSNPNITGWFDYIALRDISAGEELFMDYNSLPGVPHEVKFGWPHQRAASI